MDAIDQVVMEASVRLVRKVTWGLCRAELEAEASRLSAEGSYESGWDNYTTAARLHWRSWLHRFAAQARYPRPGDDAVDIMASNLTDRLLHEISLHEDDDDVGAATSNDRDALSLALLPSLEPDVIDAVIDAFEARGMLECWPEQLKERHRSTVETPDHVFEKNVRNPHVPRPM